MKPPEIVDETTYKELRIWVTYSDFQKRYLANWFGGCAYQREKAKAIALCKEQIDKYFK